ncbi:MAG: hypothetical protein QM781_15265 [Chitinophagaceae bacterium]
MKQRIGFFLIISLLTVYAAGAQAPSGYTAGYIIGPDQVKVEGFVKEKFKSKATIEFQSAAGKKSSYAASDLQEVGIAGDRYVTHKDDFFKQLSAGSRVTVFQKVSDASGKVIYNGSQAVGVSAGTDGAISDYFFRKSGDAGLTWISKKNLGQTLAVFFADCSTLAEQVRNGAPAYTAVPELAAQYNQCP